MTQQHVSSLASSSAYELALKPQPGPARYIGLGMAALVHLALVLGLIHGFTRPSPPKPPAKTEVDVLIEAPKPVEPPPVSSPVELPQQLRDIPRPTLVPVIEFEVQREPGANDLQTRNEGPSVVDFSPRAPVAEPLPKPAVTEPAIRQAGMVCTQMERPELPSLNWSGEAVFKILATVREGRVVATELLAARGGMDAKTRRLLLAAVEGTLRERYVCPGNHRFEQEFAFRID